MRLLSRRHLASLGLLGPVLLGISACASGGATGPHATGAVQAAQVSRVVIPGADRFAPFVTVVRHGSEIVFHNGDTDAHSVVSVPGDPVSFAMLLHPGETWTLTLTTAGTYRYYCSVHASYDAITGEVKALPNADHPNEPMEGVLVVDG